MSESADSNKIVATVIVIALVIAAGILIWMSLQDRMTHEERYEQENNVKSALGEGKTQDINDGQIKIPVPEFNFPSAMGDSIGLADLKGKIWVAEFMFTNCAGFCPQMSKQTELLQERTKDLPDLHFVSFTMDPSRDSFEALKEYGEEYKADFGRWHFLRTSLAEVQKLGREGFKLLNETDALMHSPKCALVDREGRIRGFFDGAGPERVVDFQRLEALVRKIYNEDT